MGNSIIAARRNFLEKLAVNMCKDEVDSEGLMLEDWFKNDPVFRIVRLEGKILNSLNSQEKTEQNEVEEALGVASEANEVVEADGVANEAQIGQVSH